ncbi:hypothetical protein J6590_047544 [Homalodisca vitripennis]|nr:hypothetical protein J6590_047544 [Homalodisca vitripennis]
MEFASYKTLFTISLSENNTSESKMACLQKGGGGGTTRSTPRRIRQDQSDESELGSGCSVIAGYVGPPEQTAGIVPREDHAKNGFRLLRKR